jgi:hypothetical protein
MTEEEFCNHVNDGLTYQFLFDLYVTDLENKVELLQTKVDSLEWALANMSKPIVTPLDKSQPQPGYSPMPFIVGPYL